MDLPTIRWGRETRPQSTRLVEHSLSGQRWMELEAKWNESWVEAITIAS